MTPIIPLTPEATRILSFWFEEVGPEGWYKVSADLDARIRADWQPTWERALTDGLEGWQTTPEGTMAYIILTDQFPRNMFRDEARAFATDHLALRAAGKAIHHRWDMRLPEPGRQFFYLPLMHSESQSDQDRCVRLMLTRMPETGMPNLLHARAHREVIRRFGRFPHRNGALGRVSTPAERAFLGAGGYPALVNELQAA
jgi:uncharacterized protein (DUF924 family)